MLYYLKVQVMEYSDGRKMIFFPLVSLALIVLRHVTI